MKPERMLAYVAWALLTAWILGTSIGVGTANRIERPPVVARP